MQQKVMESSWSILFEFIERPHIMMTLLNTVFPIAVRRQVTVQFTWLESKKTEPMNTISDIVGIKWTIKIKSILLGPIASRALETNYRLDPPKVLENIIFFFKKKKLTSSKFSFRN